LKIAHKFEIRSNGAIHNLQIPDNLEITDKSGSPEISYDKKMGEISVTTSDDKKQLIADTSKAKDKGTLSVVGRYKDGNEKGQDCLLNIIYNPLKWSIEPIIGMAVSGIVAVGGAFKFSKSDKKTVPFIFTALGLAGGALSAMYKWGSGGTNVQDVSKIQQQTQADFIVAPMCFGHSHSDGGDCGGADGGGFF